MADPNETVIPETPELKAARSRLANIEGYERAVAEQRERHEADKTAAADAVAAAEREASEAAEYARKSGKPFDLALADIRAQRGTAPKDALQMSPEQWRRHRESVGLY